MTLPESDPLTPAEQLEGLYGLTSQVLGLDEVDFERRISLWTRIAAQRTEASAQQQIAHVALLAIRGQITHLIGEEDKFRAEGDITAERNITERIKYLDGLLPGLELECGLRSPEAQRTSSNPAPLLEPWGIADGPL